MNNEKVFCKDCCFRVIENVLFGLDMVPDSFCRIGPKITYHPIHGKKKTKYCCDIKNRNMDCKDFIKKMKKPIKIQPTFATKLRRFLKWTRN